MARLKQTWGNALLEVEGDEHGCAEASRLWFLALAELQLRDVEEKLATLRGLQKSRRELMKQIAALKVPREKHLTADAVDPVGERVTE